jgi:hypothetical protein
MNEEEPYVLSPLLLHRVYWDFTHTINNLKTVVWVRSRESLCGLYGAQSETGIGVFPSSSVFPRQYHSNMTLHTRIPSGGEQ